VFTVVPDQYVELIEEEIEPLLKRAASRSQGFYSIHDLFGFIYGKSHQLWIFTEEDEIKALVLTTIRESSKKRILELQFAAGVEDAEIMNDRVRDEMTDELENFAVLNKCDAIQIEGRKGWKKIMGPRGYLEIAVVLEKEIAHG
tara:strand:- start:2 stop:433 length:432 start_codon:yes stop_codon:yes gene_type:complete